MCLFLFFCFFPLSLNWISLLWFFLCVTNAIFWILILRYVDFFFVVEYMSLPASQYSVLDAERIERVDDNTFRCYVYRFKFFAFEVCPVLLVRVDEQPNGCCIKLLSCKVWILFWAYFCTTLGAMCIFTGLWALMRLARVTYRMIFEVGDIEFYVDIARGSVDQIIVSLA